MTKRAKEASASDWDKAVRRRPSPLEVARLVESHGMEVAEERWPHISQRTLYEDYRKGRKQLEHGSK